MSSSRSDEEKKDQYPNPLKLQLKKQKQKPDRKKKRKSINKQAKDLTVIEEQKSEYSSIEL